MKSSIVVLLVIAIALVAALGYFAYTFFMNQWDYPTHPPISLNGLVTNGSSISVNVNSSFYIHQAILSVQGNGESINTNLTSISPLPGYPNTFIGKVYVIFNGLAPYSTYQVILFGESSPCSSPSAPNGCMDPSTRVCIVENVTTNSSGATSRIAIGVPPFTYPDSSYQNCP
jgi:hypothetical protein